MQLELAHSEHGLLLKILDRELRDLRVEVRRTDTPAYHDRLKGELEVLLGLMEKLEAAAV